MTYYPSVTIVVTTYYPEGAAGTARTTVVEQTLKSWADFMQYAGELTLHFADDGSPELESLHTKHLEIPKRFSLRSFSGQHRHGVGASLNKGFKEAFAHSPIVLYAVDDWMLIQTFDLTPWVRLLVEREDVGMVRLGPPHPGTRGVIKAFTEDWQGWGLRLNRVGYAFGHRPALYHKRMIDYYGWFAEDCSALACEDRYNTGFMTRPNGPDIVLALPHPWQHLDSVELAYVDPSKEHG